MDECVEVGDGARLIASDVGGGPAVVLLHGWPVTSYHWRLTVPALVAAGFRAVTVDLRGLGASSAGGGGYAKQVLAGDVLAVADRLGIGRFAVVGHDWGGTIGYLLAADHRDRVAALVVEEELLPGIDTPLPEPGRSHYPAWHGPFNRAEGLAEALVPGREEAFYGAFLHASAGPEPLAPEARRVYLDAYRQPGALAAGLGYYRTADADRQAVRARARRPLDLPVLAVGGQFGMGLAVRDCLREVASRVTDLQVPGAGHYPAEQRPEAVNPALISFLRRHHDGSLDGDACSVGGGPFDGEDFLGGEGSVDGEGHFGGEGFRGGDGPFGGEGSFGGVGSCDRHMAGGHAACDGHATDGHAAVDGHATDGHAAGGHAACDGHAVGGHAAVDGQAAGDACGEAGPERPLRG